MTKGRVTAIIANLVSIEVDGPVGQNEICYILHNGVKLIAEVIRVTGKTAYTQVFESTRGIKIGAEAEFTGNMLEMTLGPGLLSRNYDGLQSDLEKLAGLFLERGEIVFPLDEEKKYESTPIAAIGDVVAAAHWLGSVTENWIEHKIMAPFKLEGRGKVKWIADGGTYRIHDKIAVVE